jgi:uncharacterized zinc-type alcohol dehydrogenase-like protein
MNPSTIMGYAALATGQPLELFTYTLPKLEDYEVRVAITHCGLCFTDIQAIDDFYHITKFPFVPGHEIVGYVSEVGKTVSELKEGDRVGIGWQGRACMKCEWCLRGEVNLCQDIVRTAAWTPYGGFSSSIAVNSGFAYRLPNGMPSEVAAVLMCAGITVFTPLRTYSCSPSVRIGIIGVGGLGHLAIQFAKAFGYEVTAISSSPGKKEEALALGADQFIVAGDEGAMRKVEYYFDLLLCTAHGEIDWESMLEILKKKGKLILVGFPEMTLRPIDLVAHQLSISGSFLGTPGDMREMLFFAQTHDIQPMIELMPMARINKAIERLKENKARYRIVLVNDPKDK